ncbi:hypothetical protein [Paenibacillus sp. PSB04]|uniref:hypothetical protein n=1 Tax=Paenibacillus sp. PSB04 TaxID=2866810 RepID=UPI0021F20B9C|nr:hypothetical protein [Paenibacillus sp. PSB04]UYO04456.1 hypothetical protein K2F33_33475 [Paenibacillus sp. PSB04]
MLITRIGFARTSGEDGIVLEKRAAVAFVPGFSTLACYRSGNLGATCNRKNEPAS